MIQNKTVTNRVPSNLTILQKLKADNSIRTFRKNFIKKEQIPLDFHYRAPLSLPFRSLANADLPLPVSYFCLDK